MGAACCVASKDRTIVSRSPGEINPLPRHTRYSPTWSFRWDNRGRVAGEETPVNWLHDGSCGNHHIEVKSGTAFGSQGSSPLNTLQSPAMLKASLSDGNCGISGPQSSGQSVSQNIVEVKEPTDSLSISYPSPTKLSPPVPSMSAYPPPSQSHLLPPNLTPSRCNRHSPGHQLRSPGHQLLRQVSESRVLEYRSPTLSISEEPVLFLSPAWGNESFTGSNGGSSDSWSIPTFPELLTTRRERWSFDSEASGFSRDKIAGHNSGSASFDPQTCGICTKLLTERSIWGCANQKILSANEVAVVAVLTCAHVYHAECLECMTPEIHKYDPPCPICTYGEKRVVKMSEKALKADLDSKARKRSRRRVIDGDLNANVFDHNKIWVDERGPKMKSKPFLRRHFSFGSRASRSSLMSESNQSPSRRGFLWSRSIKY